MKKISILRYRSLRLFYFIRPNTSTPKFSRLQQGRNQCFSRIGQSSLLGGFSTLLSIFLTIHISLSFSNFDRIIFSADYCEHCIHLRLLNLRISGYFSGKKNHYFKRSFPRYTAYHLTLPNYITRRDDFYMQGL